MRGLFPASVSHGRATASSQLGTLQQAHKPSCNRQHSVDGSRRTKIRDFAPLRPRGHSRNRVDDTTGSTRVTALLECVRLARIARSGGRRDALAGGPWCKSRHRARALAPSRQSNAHPAAPRPTTLRAEAPPVQDGASGPQLPNAGKAASGGQPPWP